MRRLFTSGRSILGRKAAPEAAPVTPEPVPEPVPVPVPVPALFQHIQKTAGTTIVEIASQRYGSNMTSHGDHVGKPPGEFVDVPFVSGHFGFDFARQLMADRYSFTFLRDPVKRVLSMYYYCRRQEPDASPMYRIAQELDLESFLRSALDSPLVKSRIWNNQVWQLAHGWANLDNRQIDDFEPSRLLDMAKDNLQAFSHVGFTEDFETDRNIILESLGLQKPQENVIANAREQTSETELSPAERELLEKVTSLDQALYQYAWNIRKTADRGAP
ncbi:MAG TPA: sulfotransferase family 2 domain-containing protein [Gammaproteobacteria bacterium]|nr:sulfotransferase family 2 domain-containing protein [Gammaproteobacteria bacterium]